MIIVVVVAVKLIGLLVTNQVAITLYSTGDLEGSADQSTSLIEDPVTGKLIESWLPWFNRGDAKAAAGDFTPAIDDFEKALELAPGERECMVRVNLSLSWELLGDAYEQGGYHQGAVLLYEAAEAVIAEAGDRCSGPDEASQQLDEAGKRLAEKKKNAEQARDAEDAQQPGGKTPEEKLEDLGDKGDASDKDKANGDSRDRGDQQGSDGLTEKPW